MAFGYFFVLWSTNYVVNLRDVIYLPVFSFRAVDLSLKISRRWCGRICTVIFSEDPNPASPQTPSNPPPHPQHGHPSCASCQRVLRGIRHGRTSTIDPAKNYEDFGTNHGGLVKCIVGWNQTKGEKRQEKAQPNKMDRPRHWSLLLYRGTAPVAKPFQFRWPRKNEGRQRKDSSASIEIVHGFWKTQCFRLVHCPHHSNHCQKGSSKGSNKREGKKKRGPKRTKETIIRILPRGLDTQITKTAFAQKYKHKKVTVLCVKGEVDQRTRSRQSLVAMQILKKPRVLNSSSVTGKFRFNLNWSFDGVRGYTCHVHRWV